MYKRVLNMLILLLLSMSTASYAATKIGVVKLDILFKEIPIYKESQTNLKMNLNQS